MSLESRKKETTSILGITLTNLNTVSEFLAQIILILQCIKILENLAQPTLQHRYAEMTLYLTSSKMPFTDKDGHLTKAFQKEKHDAASQLLREYANRTETRVVVD